MKSAETDPATSALSQSSGHPEDLTIALAGVAPWAGHHRCKANVSGLIPSQGTRLGCRFGPQSGRVGATADQCSPRTSMFLSLPFSPTSLLSINVIFFFIDYLTVGQAKWQIRGKTEIFVSIKHISFY